MPSAEVSTGRDPGPAGNVVPARSVPAWVCWVMPSLRDLLFLIVFLSLTCGALAPRLFRDGGTGWHLRTGELILATHSVPRSDPFSASTAGTPWFAWEWLSDVALGAAHGWARMYGVSLVAALILALTFALLFTMLRERGTGLFLSAGLVVLSIATAAIHMFARPHIASWLLTLIWLRILESARKGHMLRLWWLVPLMILWVNVHGGFVFGLALAGIYWVDALWEAGREPTPESDRWVGLLGKVLVVCAAATLCNPYGYRLHGHVYEYLNDSFLMNHIQEFQSPNFHNFSERSFAVLLLLALAGLALWRRRLPVRSTLILLLTVSSGLYAARNLPITAMLIALVIGPIWSQIFGTGSGEEEAGNIWRRAFVRLQDVEIRMERMDSSLRGGIWMAIAVAALAFAARHGGALGTLQMQAGFEEGRFPVLAVDFLQREGLQDPVFSTDQWGGYLIYRLYPAKVLVDDRHDLYGSEFFQRYLQIVHVQPGWRDQLRALHANRVLVPVESSLAAALEGAPTWQVEYRDSTAVLFKRTGFFSGS